MKQFTKINTQKTNDLKLKTCGITRTEQLRTCRKCQNISFDITKGFICSVTSSYAIFTNQCSDFKQAAFVSSKKVLKPSQLSVNEFVKSSENKLILRKLLLVLAMVFFGCLMLNDPYLFSLEPARITDSFARKLLGFFWGVPTGLLSLVAGVYFAFRLLIRR